MWLPELYLPCAGFVEAPEALVFGIAYLVVVMLLCVVGVIVPTLSAKCDERTPVQRCKGCKRLIEGAPGKFRCTIKGEIAAAPDACDDCL